MSISNAWRPTKFLPDVGPELLQLVRESIEQDLHPPSGGGGAATAICRPVVGVREGGGDGVPANLRNVELRLARARACNDRAAQRVARSMQKTAISSLEVARVL